MKHKIELLKNFAATALCFLCAMVVIKIFDYQNYVSFLRATAHCLITSSFIVVIVFVIHLLVSLISRKVADWTSSIIFGIIVFGEIGLTIYTRESGQLMGKELFIRPISELMQTILAMMSIYTIILIILGVIGGFAQLANRARKRWHGRWIMIFVSVLAVISIPYIFFIDNVISDQLEARNNETSKMWYMAISSMSANEETDNIDITYNEQLIDEFLSDNPDFIVPDKHYPLERTDNIPDVLGPYFREIDKQPDIVLIVVESLGAEMMGNGLAPFVDSLASHSLYWKNCLSTTTRSYGAVPAITASVIGPKGFQFGVMPEHNSLFKILKSNGYQTNAFYGGDFSFDGISEYLIAQDIDYMCDFYNEYKAGDKNLGTWWGYFDHVMFNRSIEEIGKMKSPMFNTLITITNHEALNIKDDKKQQYYVYKTNKAINKMEPQQAAIYGKNKARFYSMLYTDDCLRDFIKEYQRLPNYRNTIFIITGDHSSGLIVNNKLSYHRVPLLIWSPMLEKTGIFNSLVTHNDIAPSINALLRDKYHLGTPKYVHWISDGLDTSDETHFSKKMLHVNYNREMREIVYNNYLYWTKNKWESEEVANIDDDFNLEIVYNDSLRSSMNKKLELYKYICRYTYYDNKLTNHPISGKSNYQIFKDLHKKNKVVCKTPDQMPSEVGTKTYSLFDDITIDEGAQKIKLTLDASVFINDSLWQDEYMDLVFECKTADAKTEYVDKVSKFIKSDIIRKDKWYDLSVSKEFLVKNSGDVTLSVYVSSVRYDDQWVGGTTLTIGERNLKIETD